MAMSAEHRSKFAVIHQQWGMSLYKLKILKWDEKQTKQTNNKMLEIQFLLSISRFT